MFDLFGLSRELRDHIYEDALIPKTEKRWTKKFQTRIENFAASNLLLVSRQFSEEYAAAPHRRCTLTILDRGNGMPSNHDAAASAVPEILRTVRKMEFDVFLFCEVEDHSIEICECIFQLRHYREWINDVLAQMTAVRSVDLVIFLDFESHVQICVDFLADFGAAEMRQIGPLTEARVVVPVMKDGRYLENVEPRFPLIWDRETKDFVEYEPVECEMEMLTDGDESDEESTGGSGSDGSDDGASCEGGESEGEEEVKGSEEGDAQI